MKLRFLIFETKAPDWVHAGRQEYVKKISGFLPIELVSLKSPAADRDQAELKRKKEADLLLKNLDERDFVILFDEKGENFPSSEVLAKRLQSAVESGKPRIVFCIGGPYGFEARVRARGQQCWSLSGLTFNHWLAQLAALEQIYRGFTIQKGIPYHNR